MTFNNGKAHEQVIDENGEYILVTSRAISSFSAATAASANVWNLGSK